MASEVEFLDDLPEESAELPKVDEKEAEPVSEPAPKAKRASPTKKAAKPEVVDEAKQEATEAEADKNAEESRPTTTNPKLKRLKKYGA